MKMRRFMLTWPVAAAALLAGGWATAQTVIKAADKD